MIEFILSFLVTGLNFSCVNGTAEITGESTSIVTKNDIEIGNFSQLILKNITIIDDGCFVDCQNLVNADLTGVEVIRKKAFYNLTNLKHVELSIKIKRIYDNAFSNCILITSMNLFEVDSLGNDVFQNCKNLSTLIYCGQTNIQNSTTGSPRITFVVVLMNYKFDKFYGFPVIRIMERCGIFPTYEFTMLNALNNLKFILISIVILTHGEEREVLKRILITNLKKYPKARVVGSG